MIGKILLDVPLGGPAPRRRVAASLRLPAQPQPLPISGSHTHVAAFTRLESVINICLHLFPLGRVLETRLRFALSCGELFTHHFFVQRFALS